MIFPSNVSNSHNIDKNIIRRNSSDHLIKNTTQIINLLKLLNIKNLPTSLKLIIDETVVSVEFQIDQNYTQ